MILRNSQNPRGVDLGPAQNPFAVGTGGGSRLAHRIANQLYSNPRRHRREPEFVALIAGIANQAILDARAGRFATEDVVSMLPAYRNAAGLSETDPVDLETAADWLRTDAAEWLADFGIRLDVDQRDLNDAKNALLSELQREPVIKRVA